MRKIYVLFLLALLPLVASADPVEINGIYYNLISKGKAAEVTSKPDGYYSGNIVIPATVTYNNVEYNVTSISKRAFYTSYDWEGERLTSVTIPNSVTTIGENAFGYCYDLTSVTIPNSVTTIGERAFVNCDGLTSVTIPNSVTCIGDEAFLYCDGLTSVTIGDGVTSIGWATFEGCGDLTSVTIGNSVTSIGKRAFSSCGLTSLTIPNSVTSIDEYAFSDCTSLTSVIIGDGVSSIGQEAFSNCFNLESINIPSSVKTIGCNAFYMTSEYPGYPSPSLTSVHITDLEAWCKILFVSYYSNPLTYAHHLYLNGTEIKDMVIPNSVTSIGDYSFYYCTGLTSVSIPNSVTSIGRDAFNYCRNLTSVTIPNSVTSIGYRAFCQCHGLTSLTIPNSVKSISEQAFYNCKSLTSVAIPNSVTFIGRYAFQYCRSLTSVTIGNGIGKIDYRAFAICPELTDVYCYAENVPETDEDAFEDSYIEYATLHVPAGSVDAYKAKTPWSGFKEKVAIAATVKLNKTKATIEKTKTLTLKATVTPSDLLDKSVTWKSSNTSVATVTSSGKVKGVKAGTATITCTSKVSGSKATCKVTIGYVKLDQTEATITKGKTLTLTPTVYPSSLTDKSVTWKSSNTAVATVSGDGTVKGIKAGTATITCTSNATGLSTTCTVTVINGSITLNKSEAALEKGKTMTLKATLTPSDLSDKSVTWKSSNTKVATVSSSGKVTAVKTGTATITCTSTALGLSATCKVTVGYVKLDKTEMLLKKGKTETLTATVYPSSLEDKSVTWKSSDTNIATVTTAGKVKGIKDGTVTITCTSNATGLKATCTVKVVTGSVTLDKSEVAVQKGKTLTLTATVTPTTLEDKSVTWTSSNTEVATVSSTGKVKGVKYGTATITCTSNATGLSATCQVTVGKVIISMSEFTLKKSRGITLEAIVYPSTLADKSVIWESSDTEVATVTSEGRVKGIKAGTATITCTSVATGLKGTCTVTVLSTSESRSTDGNDDNVTGIKELEENSVATEPYDVYDLSGRKVRHQVTSLDGLPDGIYIVNGRKILKK